MILSCWILILKPFFSRLNWWITNGSCFEDENFNLEFNWNNFFKKDWGKIKCYSLGSWKRFCSLKDGNWRGSHVHAWRDWYPVCFEMDWVRYWEREYKASFEFQILSSDFGLSQLHFKFLPFECSLCNSGSNFRIMLAKPW